MLSPYRVLDLTDRRAALGPMMLADLGAEVIRVDPPGADHFGADPEYLAYNRNKRSVALDIESDDGRAAVRALAATADFLVENDAPGAMAARGLGFDDLRALNPRLIYVAISPFGQDGPYAGHIATDLTLVAMGGMMAINGDADRPPVRISVPQAWRHAAAESAVAAMLALQRPEQTGEAQFVDVSVQAAVFWTTLNASIAAAIQGRDIQRQGTNVQIGTITLRALFECADGYAVLFSNNLWRAIVGWMVEGGDVDASWQEEDWSTWNTRMMSGQPISHTYDELLERVGPFVARHTRHALLERGMADGVFIAPVNTLEDVLAFPHLEARQYWQALTPPGADAPLRAPGPWVRLEKTPIAPRRPPPAPGADTDAVLAGLTPAARPEVTA